MKRILAIAAIPAAVVVAALLAAPAMPLPDSAKSAVGEARSGFAAVWQYLFEKPKAADPQGPLAPVVSTVRLSPGDITETVLVSGTLVARDEILVAPEIEGLKVLDLKVEEGATVKAGDVLATLAQDTLDAQLAQNDASLARATAAIAQAKSNIVSAEAKLAEARSAYERGQALKKTGYLDTATFESRESAAKTAEAALTASKDALKSAEADKALAEAQRRELAWRRSRTEVRAPADGIVSRRTARVGGVASAVGEPMFRIIAKGAVELEADVPEVTIAKLKSDQPVAVTTASGIAVSGRVRLVLPEIDKTTRLGKVRIALPADQGLHIGMFARGLVTTATGRGLIAPLSAVMFSDDGPVVSVVLDGRVVTRKVSPGLMANDRILLTQGVAEGDEVIAKSGTFLHEGDAVRSVPVPIAQVGSGAR